MNGTGANNAEELLVKLAVENAARSRSGIPVGKIVTYTVLIGAFAFMLLGVCATQKDGFSWMLRKMGLGFVAERLESVKMLHREFISAAGALSKKGAPQAEGQVVRLNKETGEIEIVNVAKNKHGSAPMHLASDGASPDVGDRGVGEISKQKAVLRIETEPKGATVTVNGKEISGETPLTVEKLEVGKAHLIQLFRDNYEVKTISFKPPRGESNTLHIRLNSVPRRGENSARR